MCDVDILPLHSSSSAGFRSREEDQAGRPGASEGSWRNQGDPRKSDIALHERPRPDHDHTPTGSHGAAHPRAASGTVRASFLVVEEGANPLGMLRASYLRGSYFLPSPTVIKSGLHAIDFLDRAHIDTH
jgi:hypothetical protein